MSIVIPLHAASIHSELPDLAIQGNKNADTSLEDSTMAALGPILQAICQGMRLHLHAYLTQRIGVIAGPLTPRRVRYYCSQARNQGNTQESKLLQVGLAQVGLDWVGFDWLAVGWVILDVLRLGWLGLGLLGLVGMLVGVDGFGFKLVELGGIAWV